MRVAFVTFGCKVNTYETQCMRECFLSHGFEESAVSAADVIVINSCTVTQTADRKLLKEMRSLKKSCPGALICLTGCYPQAHKDENSDVFELSDIISGTSERELLPQRVMSFLSGSSIKRGAGEWEKEISTLTVSYSEGHTRGYIKIQDGCDMRCSYCIIPDARGHMRSKPVEVIKREVSALAESGCTEIVLVGINIMFFGREFGLDISHAVQAAAENESIRRVRISSVEPERMDIPLLMRLRAEEKFCPSFHLSLQSGCDTVLKRMRRHYDTALYSETVSNIRSMFEDAAISTDIMTGFPEETREEHRISMDFVESMGFARVHVFPFSLRKNTPAQSMVQVPRDTVKRRAAEMTVLSEKLSLAYNQKYIGKSLEVLFERERSDGTHRGHSKNYLNVELEEKLPFSLKGQYKDVLITSAGTNTLRGSISDK
ncbi:MAG: tRNA (N(6)-L-threonylcarbamoyladenosine(37)-C(2))-methylthiotransferase MtaB [Oscillospiraceae bacterium]|nr:tRNA (N(6)-L-threonylcarbamoyladenosine(37)-C(2))-methylthiotransferase MtaB [Oscillospiraceae bacterium]